MKRILMLVFLIVLISPTLATAMSDNATELKVSPSERLKIEKGKIELELSTPDYKANVKVEVPVTEQDIEFLREKYSPEKDSYSEEDDDFNF